MLPFQTLAKPQFFVVAWEVPYFGQSQEEAGHSD